VPFKTFTLRVFLWTGVIVSISALYLCMTPFGSCMLLSFLQRPYKPIAVQDCQSADAIVVLGGDAPRRFEPALDLALSGKAPLLIILNTGRRTSDGQTEGEQLRCWAMSRGLDPGRAIVTRIVRNTVDESHAVAAIVQAKGLRRIILVTAAHQMLRATYLFHRAGIALFPFPVNFASCGDAKTRPLVPSKQAFWRSRMALHEFIGLAAAALGLQMSSKDVHICR